MPTNSDPTNRCWKPTSGFEPRKLSFEGDLARIAQIGTDREYRWNQSPLNSFENIFTRQPRQASFAHRPRSSEHSRHPMPL